MQASTVLLTNEYSASNVNVSSMATVKIQPSDDDVFVLLDSDEKVCHVVDLSDTSFFPYKTKSSNPVLVFVDVDKTPYNSLYMKLLHHGASTQRPPLHPFSSSSSFNIVDALKMTKSKKKSKFYLTAIDFDSIDVRDVKYLPPSFDGGVIFILPPIAVDVSSTYGRSMDGMDKMCNGHIWCTTKTTNIQNDFGFFFRRSSCARHLLCTNTYSDYLYRNGGVHNCTEWIGSTLIPFSMGDVTAKKSRLKCKVCCSTLVSIVLCHTRIIYVHFTSPGMSKACIHLGVHKYHVSNDTCCESLDIAYQCVANEVMKTPTAKNSVIVMAASKKFLVDYLLKSPSNGEGYYLAGSLLEVVMDKFSTLASPNCRNIVSGSKCFLRNGMDTMDSIMALKDHSRFKYVHDSRFPGQSKDKVFVSKC